MFTKILITAMLYIIIKHEIPLSENHDMALLTLIFFAIGLDIFIDGFGFGK